MKVYPKMYSLNHIKYILLSGNHLMSEFTPFYLSIADLYNRKSPKAISWLQRNSCQIYME
jgi:hypothetical protein